jgi:hypothetical protein
MLQMKDVSPQQNAHSTEICQGYVQMVMVKLLAALLLVAAVLTGALIAGSPVHGDVTPASATAGISLGTPAPSSGPRIQSPPIVPRLQPAAVMLLLLSLTALTVASVEVAAPSRSSWRWHQPSRRGPPIAA